MGRSDHSFVFFRVATMMLTIALILVLRHSDDESALMFQARILKQDTITTAEKGDTCFEYGCPIYPLEMEEVKDELEAIPMHIENYRQHRQPLTHYGSMDVATVTRISNRRPKVNQDEAVILAPFSTKQTDSDTDFLMGIFDGHGMHGHIMAQYTARELPYLLSTKFNQNSEQMSNEWIQQALKETFVEVDANAPPNAMLGGRTASVTIRRGRKLFVANVGDSRTIVVTIESNNGYNISYTTRRDKAHLPDERSRIEALNGTIHIPPHNPAGSRVIVYSTAHVAHREHIGLAMSRSIGDWEWGAIGVIPEPLVDMLDIGETHQMFVLAASDGLWDLQRPQFFAQQFANIFSSKPLKPLILNCLEIIQKISPKNETWYRDDITLAVKKLV